MDRQWGSTSVMWRHNFCNLLCLLKWGEFVYQNWISSPLAQVHLGSSGPGDVRSWPAQKKLANIWKHPSIWWWYNSLRYTFEWLPGRSIKWRKASRVCFSSGFCISSSFCISTANERGSIDRRYSSKRWATSWGTVSIRQGGTADCNCSISWRNTDGQGRPNTWSLSRRTSRNWGGTKARRAVNSGINAINTSSISTRTSSAMFKPDAQSWLLTV